MLFKRDRPKANTVLTYPYNHTLQWFTYQVDNFAAILGLNGTGIPQPRNTPLALLTSNEWDRWLGVKSVLDDIFRELSPHGDVSEKAGP